MGVTGFLFYTPMKFALPEGYEKPMDAEEGGEFDAVVTLVDNGDGTVTVTEIEGMAITDMGEEVEMEVEIEAPEPGMLERAKGAGVDMSKMMS